MPIVLPLPGDVNGFKDGLTQPAVWWSTVPLLAITKGRPARLSSDDGISPPGTGIPRRAQIPLIRPITRLVLACPCAQNRTIGAPSRALRHKRETIQIRRYAGI